MNSLETTLSGQTVATIGIVVALIGLLIIAFIIIRSALSQTAMDSQDSYFLRSLVDRSEASPTPPSGSADGARAIG
jgi:hypothetical protein